jgi:integrase
MAKGRRRFGWVRKLPSGRFQESYIGPDGRRHMAPDTFKSKTEADRWLVHVENLILRREWTDPERAKIGLQHYAEAWINDRPGLRPRTTDLYRWLLAKHIVPYLGAVQLGQLDTPTIRQSRSTLLRNGVSESMAAKAYRLLRAILMTATNEDHILTRNPCQVRGAGVENPAERPVLTLGQVFALADRMPSRFRTMILLTAFASLRFGEVTALTRNDIAEDASEVRISRAFVEVRGKGLVCGPPKSRAGVRTVAIPEALRPEILKHLDEFVKPGAEALVFTGAKGNALRRPSFGQRTKWIEVVTELGFKGLHFHDLRHTGNTLAAATKASTKDLMARMGHDSERAALIYQHATREADQQIAGGLSALIDVWGRDSTTKDGDPDGDDGPAGVLAPTG